MKKNAGSILLFASICAVVAIISCSLTATNTNDAEQGIDAPTVEINSITINVTSAPVKDQSFLSKIEYANIFRQKASSDQGTDAGDWINIGQVARINASDTFTNGFNFIDYYVNDTVYYRYRIRYYGEDRYVYSGISPWIGNLSGATGEQSLNETLTLSYYENRQTGEYKLNVVAPTEEGITKIEANFTELCVLLSNGSKTRPFTLVSDKQPTTTTKTIAVPTDTIEMHKILPSDFLTTEKKTVTLTPKGAILVRTSIDGSGTVDKPGDGSKFYKYYWTPAKPVVLQVLTYNESGELDIFSTAEDGSTTAKIVDTFTVPAIPEPKNPFDATPLSLSARLAPAADSTMLLDNLDLSGL